MGEDFLFFYRMEIKLGRKKLKEDNQLGNYDIKTCFFSGSFMFFRRSAFNKCGRFDKNIFLFCEEQDILKRLVEVGFTHDFENKYTFLHKVGDRKGINLDLWLIGNNSFLYYINKHNLPKKLVSKRIYSLRIRQLYYIFRFKFKEMIKVQKIIIHMNSLMKKNNI